MEHITGSIKLRNIFLDNGNWWKLFLKYRDLIKIYIIVNVVKLLICKTSLLGYHYFTCKCGWSIKVPHSCKSRFCPSCGKKATDNWIKNSFNTFPKTTWQHITFTMDKKLWQIFKINKHLLNKTPLMAANIIKNYAKKKNFLPGIFLAIHTFGRDLKYNLHIHLSTTVGGISIINHKHWINSAYFYHKTLKNIWRYKVLKTLKQEFKKNRLLLPKSLKHIKSYETFASWTSQFYNKTWVVHLNKHSNNIKINIEYLGKYLKRPPIGETRIKKYDGLSVTFEYLDHYTKSKKTISLPVLEFIYRLIQHIPDKHFRMIRYYGFMANRVKGKLMPIVYNLLNTKNIIKAKIYTAWRYMIKNSFFYDPLKCKICKSIMKLKHIIRPAPYTILAIHKEVAHGHFQPI